MSFIAEFSTDIRHIKGERNIVADALSRPTIRTVSSVTAPLILAVNFMDLAAAQDPAEVLQSSASQVERRHSLVRHVV